MLANLLQKVLPEIISDIQGAFVDGRQVIDSVVIAHECIDSRFRHHRPGVVCKLDFEKAYEMVDCDFLQYMLTRMGFGAKWRKWIHSCISLAHFSILVNGSLKGYFKI